MSVEYDNIALSLLSQYYFCPRRAGLIMLEQVWEDNEYTALGTFEHDNVHKEHIEKRGSLAKIYDMYVSSENLGVSGMCDCVEAQLDDSGAYISALDGNYILFPIEYKHGNVRNEIEYNVQLCAQAMCIEEMFGRKIKNGAIFYISAHRRVNVEFDDTLRKMVIDGINALKNIAQEMRVPKSEYSAKCMKCSIAEICCPKIKCSAADYMKSVIKDCCNLEE